MAKLVRPITRLFKLAQHNIGQRFTRDCSDLRPMERQSASFGKCGNERIQFKDSLHRIELNRFINFYNTVKPYKSLNNLNSL